jgi:SAM-dependent methyltransferase
VKSRPVLDAGCGFGRNAVAVALRGLDIVCADNDAARLSTLTKLAPAYFDQHRLPDQAPGQLRTVCIDLNASSWPFGYEEFSSIVCVQFPNFGLIDAFRKSIFRGGFLYLETFGGHGENYVDLPNAGHLRRVLEKDYELAFYRERSVGPPRYSKVSAKLLARNL